MFHCSEVRMYMLSMINILIFFFPLQPAEYKRCIYTTAPKLKNLYWNDKYNEGEEVRL